MVPNTVTNRAQKGLRGPTRSSFLLHSMVQDRFIASPLASTLFSLMTAAANTVAFLSQLREPAQAGDLQFVESRTVGEFGQVTHKALGQLNHRLSVSWGGRNRKRTVLTATLIP